MNHPSGDLGVACLALTGTREEVVLWYQRALRDMDLDGFQSLLGSFVELAARLYAELSGDGVTEQADAEPPASMEQRIVEP